MGEPLLPMPTPVLPTKRRHFYRYSRFIFCALVSLLALQLFYIQSFFTVLYSPIPINAERTLARCRALDLLPGPSTEFYKRSESDRYVLGTRATLILNARIWTGGYNGTEVLQGHIYFDKGIIKGVGGLDVNIIKRLHSQDNLNIVNVEGAWVTPGIVDAHSHLGVLSAPALSGANDGNSHNGPVLPWLRSLDGLNTRDESYSLSIAGGVTTALILPGSANAIGGQAFTIKLRKTAERSPTAMLIEPPHELNGTFPVSGTVPWRQIKHACGENPSRVYSGTRMDTFWAFRQAYDRARQIKEKQDVYCKKALSAQWRDLGEFPEDLKWEALVDVLRGRVRVQTHCYEAVDLDDLIRLSNEFKFSIAAVHHAHEAYLVPDVLKRAYGSPPAAAIFATHARYKREAYRGSEFAPRILAENGIQVVLKSDHPVSNSRYLLFDAQQAHYYGLPENLALGAVTTQPAQVVGLGHRIGHIKEGWDADLVVWDSHPLALGATPSQVYIDGISQLELPYVVDKPNSLQNVPKVPNFDREATAAIEYEGLPPLLPDESYVGDVLFKNVKNFFVPGDRIRDVFATQNIDSGVVMVRNGSIACSGSETSCSIAELADGRGRHVRIIDLKGGSISPSLVSYGSALGVSEIQGEVSTGDGAVPDPLSVSTTPTVEQLLVRAVDGLQFAGRDALLAYRAGVTRAIVAPSHTGFVGGLGVEFSLGARHKLENGAVNQEVTGLHVSILQRSRKPSVSTQIAVLRQWLFTAHAQHNGVSAHLLDAVRGHIPLVVETHSADVIATLVELKREFEANTGLPLRMTITGATEAHLLASELAEAGVGVILTRPRPFPGTWEQRRILPGPPLSSESAVLKLLAHNVTVGVGIEEPSSAAATRFDLGWIALEAGGRISRSQAIALASTNLKKLLSGNRDNNTLDLVATQGGDLLSLESKVVAVILPARGVVDFF
ncbi:carbohydrate esterase family 9 protein [Multifurca ochricompacta]|uniref:Carbohydrate esterase family 9 protein n=1 Tax=Multifurca ochricompacta TaxID=376703 RepID=A0AAD4QR60_9AGAM|nr:carbohydrate esterase family 9 protein [Multifurca ochricompacta]